MPDRPMALMQTAAESEPNALMVSKRLYSRKITVLLCVFGTDNPSI